MPASSRSNCPRCSTRPSWSVVAMFASICLRVQETDIVARTGHFSTLHNPDVHPDDDDCLSGGDIPVTCPDLEAGLGFTAQIIRTGRLDPYRRGGPGRKVCAAAGCKSANTAAKVIAIRIISRLLSQLQNSAHDRLCRGAGEIHVEVGTALVVLSGFPQPGQGERPHVARDTLRTLARGSSRSVSVARGGARPAGRAVSTSGRGSGVDAGRELRSPPSWAARPAGGGPGGAGLRLCRQGGIRHCGDPRPDRADRGRRDVAPPVRLDRCRGGFERGDVLGRPGDPATRRPGDPATRRPGDPATRRPGDPATRRPGDPATRRPGDPAFIIPGASSGLVKRKPREERISLALPRRPGASRTVASVARIVSFAVSIVFMVPGTASEPVARSIVPCAHACRAPPVPILLTIRRARLEHKPASAAPAPRVAST